MQVFELMQFGDQYINLGDELLAGFGKGSIQLIVLGNQGIAVLF